MISGVSRVALVVRLSVMPLVSVTRAQGYPRAARWCKLLAGRLREAGRVIQCLPPHGTMSHPEPSASHRRRADRLLNAAHYRQISVDADLNIVNGR